MVIDNNPLCVVASDNIGLEKPHPTIPLENIVLGGIDAPPAVTAKGIVHAFPLLRFPGPGDRAAGRHDAAGTC
jgi:hypothetical protein